MGKDKVVKSTYTVTEVAGMMDPGSIRDALKVQCDVPVTEVDGSKHKFPMEIGKAPRIIDVTFPTLSLGPDRTRQLRENDEFLAGIMDRMPSKKYSLIYATSPQELKEIEEESLSYSLEGNNFQEPLHGEFKRDFSDYIRAGDNLEESSLFRRYQFLSAGIFMGGIALFMFLTVLYIALSALLSLKVSYASFEKDTAPGSQAQKKQQ